MNADDKKLFMECVTSPERNGGSTVVLTHTEAEEVWIKICSVYAHFEPKAWVIGQIFDRADDFVEFWVDHNPSEELFIQYINYIQNVKCDEIALQVIADWLTTKDHDNCDVYYLNSGRVVRFFNTL